MVVCIIRGFISTLPIFNSYWRTAFLWASSMVKSTFARYDRVRNIRGITGAQAAETILHQAGIYNVSVQRISGSLTDHYDPAAKVLRLSDSVFGATSVAAIGVAAHECGHAIQDQQDYAPLRIRTSLVPICNFGQPSVGH